MNQYIESVPLEKAYRLLNHGPTVLVSSKHEEEENVMAAAWACVLEFNPAKMTVVLDKKTKTREIIEKNGYFVLQVPCLPQAKMTYQLGSMSKIDCPDKLERCGTTLFYLDNVELPLVEGCIAWVVCKVIPEPHNQETHDLFIGSVVGAWADSRVFKNGHWEFANADKNLRSLHYIAGGTFLTTGDEVKV